MRQPSSRIFSFLGIASASPEAVSRRVDLAPPHLKLESDREVYRPGERITITIEIRNSANNCSLLIENLSFECKGIEKLDNKWFNTYNHSKQFRLRGEYVFMDCSTSTLVSNQILSGGATKTYVVRTLLPDNIPPSYKGTTIRYLYYIRTTLSAQFQILEKGHSLGESIQEFPQLEARLPLQIWVNQKSNGRIGEEGCIDGQGIVPLSTILLDIYWKEMDADSEWAKVNESFDGNEEGYGSSQDEMLSVSSYKAMKEDINKPFGSSLSLLSLKTLFSNRGHPYVEVRPSISLKMAPPRLSVAEVIHDSTSDAGQLPKHMNCLSMEDESRIPSGFGSTESIASEEIVSGRSYNIKMDGQVLLRFSPKNSESTYYFSDMIGGTLTFFHNEGVRRCLELSVTLETKETIHRCSVTKHSSTITKIHSDHHEVVADLVQTSFLFSIPVDGPMSFSTSYVSVEWALRFEFLATPKNVELGRFEHPLVVEGRDKCEWIFPITVHAPPLGAAAAQTRNEKLLFSGSMLDI